MSRKAEDRHGNKSDVRRERLREKGQFWTPDWVAEAMTAYVLSTRTDHIFDPAVGAGAFLRAAKRIAAEQGRRLSLLGTEIDPNVLEQARTDGLGLEDLSRVELRNFVLDPPAGPFNSIVANPPYIRHHRLPLEMKAELRAFGYAVLGKALDGRAGLHIYFLLRALNLLNTEGRLAFIMPADTCEGVFSSCLWKWITHQFRLDAVVTFTGGASPFPSVDTNPVILMISRSQPRSDFWWACCREPGGDYLKNWIVGGFCLADRSVEVVRRQVDEALATGLSRRPSMASDSGIALKDVARVCRGVASGANDFFFMTRRRAELLEIPSQFLVSAVGRTRDVNGDRLTLDTLDRLEARGRPTRLLSLPGWPAERFPAAVREYLRYGESLGLHRRSLISQRRPWYRMEFREPPPILFAYLGRRSSRFIWNDASVVPLTGFLCVYPRRTDSDSIESLWEALRSPDIHSRLAAVAKTYGGGAMKVEPRALERLILPLNETLSMNGGCGVPGEI